MSVRGRNQIWVAVILGVVFTALLLYPHYNYSTSSTLYPADIKLNSGSAGINHQTSVESISTRLQPPAYVLLPSLDATHISDVDLPYLTFLEKETQNVIDDIWTEWNVTYYPLFLTMMHIPPASWDLQKAKFIKLIIEAYSGSNATFIAGFSGSSVTAGHGK